MAMETNEKRYPEKIRQKLEERGYFRLTREERVASFERCLDELSKVNVDHDAAMQTLRVLRGRV